MNPDILDKIFRAIIVFLHVEKLGCTNSSWKRVTIGEDPGLLDATAAVSSDTDDTTKRLKIARDRTLALAFLKQADRRRFGTLWADLENQFSRGNDQYPIDLTLQPACQFQASQTRRDAPEHAHL